LIFFILYVNYEESISANVNYVFNDEDDYYIAIEEKWEEEFEIDQEQLMLNLGQDWLEENEW
jgi:hypothetical protein